MTERQRGHDICMQRININICEIRMISFSICVVVLRETEYDAAPMKLCDAALHPLHPVQKQRLCSVNKSPAINTAYCLSMLFGGSHQNGIQ